MEGLEDVFAIGDCCNFPQHKMAAHAGDHGETVADNIKRPLQGYTRKEYKPSTDILEEVWKKSLNNCSLLFTGFVGMVVTIGKNGGVGNFNGWNLPSFAVKRAKGTTLFTEKYWSVLGQLEPN